MPPIGFLLIDLLKKVQISYKNFFTGVFIKVLINIIIGEEDHLVCRICCPRPQHTVLGSVIIIVQILKYFSGSDFFSDILKSNHTNLVIYLKGIKNAELKHVTDFLYEGETSIAREELNKFLETAQELQVKGLQGDVLSVGKNVFQQKITSSESKVGEKESKHESNDAIVNQESNLDPLEEEPESLDKMDTSLVKIKKQPCIKYEPRG